MALYTQTGYSTGKTLEQIYIDVMYNLGHVSGGNPNYSRIPQSVVLEAINESQREIARRCPSIRKICIINATAEQGWYLCPANMIPNGIKAAYYYTASDEYHKLEIWDREKLDFEYAGWKVADSGDPLYIVPGHNMYGNRHTIEVYPKVETAGSYTVEDKGVYLGGAPGTATTSVTGLATGGSTTELQDTEVDLTTLGLAAGMVVWNVTDAGYASISSIAADAITLDAAMTNAADFGAGDSYEIITDFSGVISDWDDDDEQYIFSSELGAISDMQPNANNIVLEYLAYPINLSIPTDYPQLVQDLQTALVYMATSKCAGKGHEKTRQLKLAAMYDARAEILIDPFERACQGQPFADMKRRVVVRMRGRNRIR